MPNIPGIKRTVSEPGAVDAGSIRVTPAANPTGSAMADLGNVVREIGVDLHETFQKSKAQEALAGSQKRLQDFAFGLKNGSVNEDGSLRPPPPPDEHEKLLNEEVQKIKDESGNNLYGSALRAFDSEFEPYVQRQTLQVKADALDVYKGQIAVTSDNTLEQMARNHVKEGPIGKASVRSSAMKVIEDRVAAGVWTPEQGLLRQRKFDNDSLKGDFMKIVKSSPAGPRDAIKAIDKGEFDHLPADDLERLRNQALTEEMHNIDRAVKLEDRAYTRAQRKKTELGEAAFKEGMDIINSPDENTDITDTWLASKKPFLNPEHYKFFSNHYAGKGPAGQPDLQVVADLTVSVGKGEAPIQQIVEAGNNGQITSAIAIDLLNKVSSQEFGPVDSQNWRKNGAKEIEHAFEAVKTDPSRYILAGDATREWMEFTAEYSKATESERTAKLNEIKDSYLRRDYSNALRAQRAPRFLEGGKKALNVSDPIATDAAVRKAYDKTQEEFKAGRLSPFEYRQEMRNFAKLGRSIKPLLDKEAAKKKAQGAK